MRRRDFLKFGSSSAVGLGAVGLGSAGLVGCGASEEAPAAAPAVHTGKTFRWTLSMAVPRTFPLWAEAVAGFAKQVHRLSAGRLQIEVLGRGDKIAGLPETFDAVKSGRIEMAHAAAYYWIGKSTDLQAAAYFTTVPFGMDATGMTAWLQVGGGQELYDELYAPHGLKALPCGNTGVQAGGWFRKPIESIADFQGLKMRIPGFGGKVLARVGASPENIPPGDIYLALQTGRIDATEWVGPYHDYIQKFHQVAPYYYTGGWHEPGATLELLINKAAWESLPDDLQGIVTASAAACDRDMAARWTAKDSEYYHKLEALPDLQIQPFPAGVTEALEPEAAAVLEEIRDSSPIAKRIHDSYHAFMAQHKAWFAINNLAYLKGWA